MNRFKVGEIFSKFFLLFCCRKRAGAVLKKRIYLYCASIRLIGVAIVDYNDHASLNSNCNFASKCFTEVVPTSS